MAFVVAALRTRETRQLVKVLLEMEGHTSAIFDAGGAAVSEALAGAPDVLIIETQLADMSVVQVCDAVRAHPSTATIPIVVCGPTEPYGERFLRSVDGRVLHAALPSCLRETVAAALAAHAGDPASRLRRQATTDAVWPIFSPPGAVRGLAPPDTDIARPAQTEGSATSVLLVEDDASIAEPLIEGLARYGFPVDWVATG